MRLFNKSLIETAWGDLDGFIVNVGDGRNVPDPIPNTKQREKVWQTIYETALNTARVFLPMLQKSKGCLLFIASITGFASLGAPVD